MTEFGVVTRVGRSFYLGASYRPHHKGAWTQHPQNLSPSLHMSKQFDLQRRSLV